MQDRKHPTCVEVTGMVELATGTQAFMCTRYCPREPKTPGQVAYEAWRERRDHYRETEVWVRLRMLEQGMWEDIARLVIKHHIGNNELSELMADKLIIGNNTGEIRGILNDERLSGNSPE